MTANSSRSRGPGDGDHSGVTDCDERRRRREDTFDGDCRDGTEGPGSHPKSQPPASGSRIAFQGTPASLLGPLWLNSYLQLRARRTTSGTTDLTIRGEDSNHVRRFTIAPFPISSGPRTTASVKWSPPPWRAGLAAGKRRTPNLSAVTRGDLQRWGWVCGNALMLIITGRKEAPRRGLRQAQGAGTAYRVRNDMSLRRRSALPYLQLSTRAFAPFLVAPADEP
jgi:hypothetical protein